ncbi:shufflon system plasmid conjugative transfer pilus tip adhesin PilV [Enterobacter hormaechei]|uniref:shufflon system plasmid conjugative transfer pilus tip adhesin PilV n=1 Tax=Enterobacter hormaechei TaxID=158836 RepID=UPI00294A254B|nr:shufflon system plasmid conjugative transfer pilus tip adhesin PilV [Enterobacter hormaechei]MDV5353188.1 shufflon system plasmid conjugative transfer pilus tip adhesin PilV [Enterobacter hormaechei]
MKKHDRGWANLDVALSLLVVMAMAVFGLTKYKDWQQEKNWQVEAAHISTYAAAARGYVGRNYATLLSATSTTAPTVITTAMLKNTGFLPSGFTETNSLGQRMNTYLVRNGQNTELLQGMVVSSGGSVYPAKALRLISRDIKTGFGGYIDDGKTATGALRTWKIPLSSYGATSGNGHIVVLLSTDELSGAQEDNDRLYRFQVNGRPDLNKMHTAIDMGGNNLNSVGTINGKTGTFSGNVSGLNGIFSQNITAGAQVKGATVRADSDISAGRNITATNEVSGATVKATGNLSAGGVLQLGQVNVAGIACYPNGLISRDASGGVLSCQSGVWISGSIYNGNYTVLGAFVSTYTSVNDTGRPMTVYASGGVSTIDRGIKDGDNCRNTWDLKGMVDGRIITSAGTANSDWSKSGTINFIIPAGSTFSVTSNPLPSYGCSPGSFNLVTYH